VVGGIRIKSAPPHPFGIEFEPGVKNVPSNKKFLSDSILPQQNKKEKIQYDKIPYG